MKIFTLSVCMILNHFIQCQNLVSGYNQSECEEMLKITARFGTEEYYSNLNLTQNYQFLYRSAPVGLDNCWDLWTKDNHTAVISIRGTTLKNESWLANFYAAMVPAKGSLKISEGQNFDYDLAAHPRAAVHVGWMLSTAYLALDIRPKIDSCYRAGIRNIVVTGQSQGGAIAYLITAYLYGLQRNDNLADDIRIKTYCFAAPKPGNSYFSYEYEAMTAGGWSYTVQNAADWVPQLPISVQTLDDFNTTNPFKNAKKQIRKTGFPKNLALKHVYNKLDKPTRKAASNYQKYLGKMLGKQVQNFLPEFDAPIYYNSNDYCRTGQTIMLMPDQEYFMKYPDDDEKIFVHHLHEPYYMLLQKLKMQDYNKILYNLDGSWILEKIFDQEISDTLITSKQIELRFDDNGSKLSGFNGCNNFYIQSEVDGYDLKLSPYATITKKFCEGDVEASFMKTLMECDSFEFSEDKNLILKNGDLQLIRFRKK